MFHEKKLFLHFNKQTCFFSCCHRRLFLLGTGERRRRRLLVACEICQIHLLLFSASASSSSSFSLSVLGLLVHLYLCFFRSFVVMRAHPDIFKITSTTRTCAAIELHWSLGCIMGKYRKFQSRHKLKLVPGRI
jgi:hypothetical protein